MRLADEVAKQDGDEAALGSSGLCNGQPYPAAPAAPVPACPAGCARAQGLETAWKRDSHGTGIGHSSSEAFWIPRRPPVQAAPVSYCLRPSSSTARLQTSCRCTLHPSGAGNTLMALPNVGMHGSGEWARGQQCGGWG